MVPAIGRVDEQHEQLSRMFTVRPRCLPRRHGQASGWGTSLPVTTPVSPSPSPGNQHDGGARCTRSESPTIPTSASGLRASHAPEQGMRMVRRLPPPAAGEP